MGEKILGFQVSDEIAERVRLAAIAEDWTVSAWLRRATAERLARRTRRTSDEDEVPQSARAAD